MATMKDGRTRAEVGDVWRARIGGRVGTQEELADVLLTWASDDGRVVEGRVLDPRGKPTTHELTLPRCFLIERLRRAR